MKAKQLLLALVPATLMALATACSDYDNGFTEKDLKYVQDFKAAYGDIDPDQDWNLAERSSVTVTTERSSNVKVFALVDGQYSMVGDYRDVLGEQKLGIDIREDVTVLIVTDGKVALQTVPGGSVSFSGTRTVYEGTTGLINVRKITEDGGITIGGVNYPMYLEATSANYDDMKSVIPEIGYRKNYTNLNRVAHDFTYVSTGKFIIYPYYWETSSYNTIGIYYYDSNNRRQEVDVYTIKSGDELQYHKVLETYSDHISLADATTTSNSTFYETYSSFTWKDRNNNLLQNLGLPNGNLLSRFSSITVDFTMKKWTPAVRLLFYKSDNTNKSLNVLNPSPSADGEQQVTQTINLQSLVDTDPTWRDYLENCSEVRLAGNSYDFGATEFNAPDGTTVIGDIVINDVYFSTSSDGGWQSYSTNFCSEIFTNNLGDRVRGQGIEIDIEPGTVFGMYLKKSDTVDGVTTPYTFYSESALNNNPNTCGYGVRDDGQGNVILDENINPCYASTFHANGQMYLGFEDWPNNDDASDFDLNDVVFAFSGATPTIINEDPTPAATWFIACEDLGGSFDTDYNDVIFKVEHVSGQTHASITPMAAGGTLASYLFFEDPTTNEPEVCFGEIHQLFGVEPMNSGYYSPINVGASRGNPGQSKTFTVSEDWTLAHYTSEDFDINSQYSKNGKEINMGGFAIYVLPEGVAPLQGKIYSTNGAFGKASIIAAPGTGDAPMMVCFPYTYTQGEYTYAWAWPRELCTIADGIGGGAYPAFAGWVNDHTTNTDWYKYPNVNTVSELKWKNTDEPSQEQGGGEEQQPVDNRRIPQIGGVPSINWISTGSAISGNSTFFVPNGQNVWFKLTVNGSDYTGSGTWTATINQGNTESTVEIWNQNGGSEINMVAKGDSYGQATVTLTFSGDENYKSASVTYILKNMEKVHFTRSYGGNKWAMAINDDNKLILTGDAEWDNNQNWYLVDPGVGDGRFWLYNVGKQLFVSFGNESYATELSADVPTGTKSSRLTMDEYGHISDAYHGPTYVFGVKVEGGVAYVVLLKNKSDNAENIITFE